MGRGDYGLLSYLTKCESFRSIFEPAYDASNGIIDRAVELGILIRATR